jgi:hypothetical protein
MQDDTSDAGSASEGTDGGSADGAAPGTGATQTDASDKDSRLAQARFEAIEERKQRKAVEDELKKLKDAQLSEDERKTARLAELEAEHVAKDAKIQTLQTENALAFAAVEASARHPREAAKLIAHADVKYGEDGQPTNAADLVEKLKKRMPELFTSPTGNADGGARTTPPGGAQDMNTLLRQAAGRG